MNVIHRAKLAELVQVTRWYLLLPAQLFPIHNEIPHSLPAEFFRSAP